jgi:hypothetical protein
MSARIRGGLHVLIIVYATLAPALVRLMRVGPVHNVLLAGLIAIPIGLFLGLRLALGPLEIRS